MFAAQRTTMSDQAPAGSAANPSIHVPTVETGCWSGVLREAPGAAGLTPRSRPACRRWTLPSRSSRSRLGRRCGRRGPSPRRRRC
ncbi:hypothetical protein [Ornithinimicrobium kibberense]|uniref:hypothetical protein n=1 Tax=Ornithinimicrobium kibberense TaxID=282060 RepID=UPI003620E162